MKNSITVVKFYFICHFCLYSTEVGFGISSNLWAVEHLWDLMTCIRTHFSRSVHKFCQALKCVSDSTWYKCAYMQNFCLPSAVLSADLSTKRKFWASTFSNSSHPFLIFFRFVHDSFSENWHFYRRKHVRLRWRTQQQRGLILPTVSWPNITYVILTAGFFGVLFFFRRKYFMPISRRLTAQNLPFFLIFLGFFTLRFEETDREVNLDFFFWREIL